MASGNIKGITIDIGGDTKGLTEALKDVNAESKKTQSELKEVEKALKFDPGNVELIRQKQELLTQSIQQTSDKLDTLKTAQSQVQAQFDRGDIGAEQYRAFQRELTNTEAALRGYESQLSSMDSQQNNFTQAQQKMQAYMNATGKSADDLSSVIGTRLASAIKNGSASADQLEMAINRIGRQAGHTGDDMQEFQRILSSVGDNADLSGVRHDLMQIGQAADEAEKDISGLGSALGGLAAGGGIAGTFAAALDVSSLNTQIEISMNLNEADTATVRKSIMETTAAIGDEEAAYEGVRRQMTLNKDTSAEVNAEIIKGASTIAYAYKEIDFKELIQESHEIGKELGISQQVALGLVNGLLDVGFPPEQLDIIAEYGSQLKMAGYNAEQIQGILAAGVDTGTWNIDILMDGLKEGRIVAAEFGQGVDDAMKEAIKGTTISADKLEKWGNAVASGGQDGVKAMQEMNQALSLIDDDTKRNEIGVKMYGTLWEEQGGKISQTIQGMNEHIRTAAQNTTELNSDMSALDSDPAYKLSVAIGSIKEALAPMLASLGELIAKIATWATENVTLISAIVAIGTVVGVLVGAFAALMPAIGALITAWPVLLAGFGAISAPIAIAVAAIVGLGAAFVALWRNSETFRDNLTSIFESIKAVAVTVFETLASFIGEKMAQIQQFWNENGAQILRAAQNLFNGILAVVEFCMPAIQLLIDVVWGAIKNIITGALDVIMGAVKIFSGLFTGDFGKMWEGVKQLFKGAIDVIIGWMSLTFVGGIRTLITNLSKTVLTAIKTKWTSVVGLFKSGGTNSVNAVKNMATSVVSFVKNLATNFVNTISSMKKNVVNKMTEVKDGIVNKVKEIDLVQIGKDVINGLIKGITSMTKAAIESITGVVDGVLNKAKKMLGIASPSKVFKQIGLWTGEGMAIGIDGSSDKVNQAMENIGDGILAVSDSYQKEYSNLIDEFNKKNEDKNDKTLEKIYKIQNNAAKKKRKLTKYELQEIALLEASYKDSKYKSEADFNKKYQALVEKSEKEYLEVIKKHVDDKKSLEQLSLLDEAAIWEQSLELFAEGTNERIKAQQEYKKAVGAVNKEITTINAEYSGQVQKINEDLIKSEEALNKAYEDAVTKRQSSLVNFKGTFDEFRFEMDKTGEELMTNLRSQVNAFEEWQRQIDMLTDKAINEGLLAELKEMGPNALPQLIALNSMTDSQLTEYSDLYAKKSRLAREQAEKELIGMNEDTDKQIKGLRDTANKQLDGLQMEWNTKIKSLTESTDTELSSLEKIGRDAGNGLLQGLSSTADSIQKKALEIAESVSNTIADALKIKSPSRVTMGFGVNVNEGLIKGIEQSQNKLQNAMDSVYGSLSSSAEKSQNVNLQKQTAAVTKTTSNSMPVTVELNYSGSSPMQDVMAMVDIIERELTNRFNNQLRLQGSKGG
ncbi:hypothetical protein [Solibacillus sp. FSL K6-1523]|uniref:hypothetical protein n=1 Tax=Solibacillus sp. FSL K6-1523 TaxID=2921471 RepID=UPI0030FC19A2